MSVKLPRSPVPGVSVPGITAEADAAALLRSAQAVIDIAPEGSELRKKAQEHYDSLVMLVQKIP